MKIAAPKIFFLLCMFMHSVTTYPIQDSVANAGTFLVACLCSLGGYQAYRELPSTSHPVFLMACGCVITTASYHLFHQSTPIGRLKRANALLNEIARHTLARITFDNEGLFFDTIQDVYLTDDLPLISAYNHLLSLVPMVRYALSLINKASAEVGKDVLLQEECDASLSRANKLFSNISDAIKRIRDHKDYLSQLTIYKESLLQEKQTVAQEHMAIAQLQIAHAQQSNTLLNWLKLIFSRK
jgi:hypothetical protein